jgi:hypothetical protein
MAEASPLEVLGRHTVTRKHRQTIAEASLLEVLEPVEGVLAVGRDGCVSLLPVRGAPLPLRRGQKCRV